MDNKQVAEYIKALKDKNGYVRRHAAEALGKIGGGSAVPALTEALKDEHETVRWVAAEALGKIGDASAVPALTEALKDEDGYVRRHAAEALGKMGDRETLPRKILATAQLSAEKRDEILKALSRVRYNHGNYRLRYTFRDTRSLCHAVLAEGDGAAGTGAQTVLNWLNGERDLLKPSQADTANASKELLRVAQEGGVETRPDTLLRASEASEPEAKTTDQRQTLWNRLFPKRKDGAK